MPYTSNPVSLSGGLVSIKANDSLGFPNVMELCRPSYGWQNDIDRRLQNVHLIGKPKYPIQKWESRYFLLTENEDLGSQIFMAGPTIVNNTDSSNLDQNRVNRQLYNMAVLSRGTTTAITKNSSDSRLCTLKDDFEKSYACYRAGIYSEDPSGNLESNVASLMSKTVALTRALDEIENPTGTTSVNHSDYSGEPYDPDAGNLTSARGSDTTSRVKAGLLGGFTDAGSLVSDSRGGHPPPKGLSRLRGLLGSRRHRTKLAEDD